jgi:hypothetical protein
VLPLDIIAAANDGDTSLLAQVYTWLGCTVELSAPEGDVDDVTDVV